MQRPNPTWIGNDTEVLFTDLYELTMLQGYFHLSMHDQAVFSLFIRKLPQHRNFFIFCGLADILCFLENLRFKDKDIQYLHSLGLFSDDFLQSLADFCFTGDVFAMPEGTVCFANEPLLEIRAPIAQAQLLETFILNQVHYQTLAASKAVRVKLAAEDRNVFDFGLRRIHGLDAGLKSARAFYIVGIDSTSNVYAGYIYGIPVSGTMAHSFIQAHNDELEAFQAFTELYPETILLVDTYDSLLGVKKVVELAQSLGKDFHVKGIRIDSSDLIGLSYQIRDILDSAGLYQVKIFASGGLDEFDISNMVQQRSPIDGFGVGTKMGVSNDLPYLDMVYKLTMYAGQGCFKKSPGKETLPGQKQVYRQISNGKLIKDILSKYEENQPGQPLIHQVMQQGERLKGSKEDLEVIRKRVKEELSLLPAEYKGINQVSSPISVSLSPELQKEKEKIEQGS